MNFQFSDEAEALRDQARKFLTDKSGREKARAVMNDGASHDAALWGEMVALGWTALRIPEEFGGLGLSILELCVLAEEIGRMVSPVPFTSSVLLATEVLIESGTDAQKAKWLPKLADGSAVGTVAFAEASLTPGRSKLKAVGGTLSGIKAPVADATIANFVIVATAEGLVLVEEGAGICVTPLETIDKVRSSSQLSFTNAPCTPLNGGLAAQEKAIQSAAVLLAFEGLGGADAAMEMAVSYAKERTAFGRHIGGYQAVKHRLADMYIKNQLARSHACYGAWALLTDAPELAEAAAGARLAALDAFAFAAEENVQLHGGIGYTWESDCQFYYRRARHITLLLGTKAPWADRLVRTLEQRNAPIAA